MLKPKMEWLAEWIPEECTENMSVYGPFTRSPVYGPEMSSEMKFERLLKTMREHHHSNVIFVPPKWYAELEADWTEHLEKPENQYEARFGHFPLSANFKP